MSNDNTTNITPETPEAKKAPLLERVAAVAKVGFEKAKKPLMYAGVGLAGLTLYIHQRNILDIHKALDLTYDEDADEFYFAAIEAPPVNEDDVVESED